MLNIDDLRYLTQCMRQAEHTYTRLFGRAHEPMYVRVTPSNLRAIASLTNKSISKSAYELYVFYNNVKFYSSFER